MTDMITYVTIVSEGNSRHLHRPHPPSLSPQRQSLKRRHRTKNLIFVKKEESLA